MNDALRQLIADLCVESPFNRLPAEFGGAAVYEGPIIGVVRGDDPIFGRFREVVGPEHLKPTEMWLENGLPDSSGLASRLRVVSVVFPYAAHIRAAAEKSDDPAMPPEVYCVARNIGDSVMGGIMTGAAQFLKDRGFHVISPESSPSFRVIRPPDVSRIRSNWSQRHVAFAAGLGSMSLQEALISEAGCNHRLDSIITDAPLAVTPRLSDEPHFNCVYMTAGACGKCMERCPAGAITPAGHDKAKCMAYGHRVEEEMTSRPIKRLLKPRTRVVDGRERTTYSVGCALCQFCVPCSSCNPAASRV